MAAKYQDAPQPHTRPTSDGVELATTSNTRQPIALTAKAKCRHDLRASAYRVEVNQMLSRRFSKLAVAKLRPHVASIANGIVDDLLMAGHERFDLVPTIARPLCVRVIFHLIGFESDDFEEVTDQVQRWADDASHVSCDDDYCNPDVQLFEWWEQVIAERRALIDAGSVGPAGLMSEILKVHHDGEKFGRHSVGDDSPTVAVHLLMTTGVVMIAAALAAVVARVFTIGDASLLNEPVDLVSQVVRENLTFEPTYQPPHLCDVIAGKPSVPNLTRGSEAGLDVCGAADNYTKFVVVGEGLASRRDQSDEMTLGVAPQRCVAEHLATAVLEEGLRVLLARIPDLRISSNPDRHPTMLRYANSLVCTLERPDS